MKNKMFIQYFVPIYLHNIYYYLYTFQVCKICEIGNVINLKIWLKDPELDTDFDQLTHYKCCVFQIKPIDIIYNEFYILYLQQPPG